MGHTKQDILDNMGLVYKIAHLMRPKHTNNFVDFDDLVSEGTLGLMDAFDKYNPGRGAKFSTYASIRIRGRMLDAYRGSFWQKRVGRRKGLPAPSYVHLDADSYEDGSPLHDLVPGKFLSEQDLINRVDVTMVWEKVWHRLRPGEKKTVTLLRSGLNQREASEVLGVTASMVSQNYHNALIRLREYHSKSRR
jgi:RNA polymerase sigma factor (sigma-70 family)